MTSIRKSAVPHGKPFGTFDFKTRQIRIVGDVHIPNTKSGLCLEHVLKTGPCRPCMSSLNVGL